jgi:TetR/AcrR family transcriptional regulator, regulator of cefoperazone and chloramphenicol sensitivity
VRAKPLARAAETDAATRDRLLAVGTRLFAERGFARVTVRDICAEAGANVAAINYHFAGKEGLYMEVLRTAVTIMRGTTEEMIRAGEGQPPEAQLEILVRTFLQRVMPGRDGWIHQLMLQEMREPTAGLDLVVEQVIGPRFAYVRDVVARLLDCDATDPRVVACATSVQSQLMVVLKSPVAAKLGLPTPTVDDVPEIAAHITRFSLAGIRAIGVDAGLGPQPDRGRRSRSTRRGLPPRD